MNQYTKGRAIEYKAVQLLKKSGWETIRAAGSHGMFDIWASRYEKGRIYLRKIQIKSGKTKPTKEISMIKERKPYLPERVNEELWWYPNAKIGFLKF